MRSQEDIYLMYKDYNKSDKTYAEGKDVVDYYKEMVDKYPEKPALVYENNVLTYRQLDEKSDSLAYSLIRKGVCKGDCVAVLMTNKMDFIVAVLGIAKINATYVPIDPDYFDERIRCILEDSQSKVLIADKEGAERFPFADLYEDLLVKTECPLQRESSIDTYLCVFYTSGTTGKPKGALIPQRGVIRLVVGGYYHYSENDRMLQTSTVVFDISIQEIWGSLMNGITLYVTRKQDILEARRIGQLIEQYQTNFAFMSTALFAELVRQKADAFAPLKTLVVGGDTLYPSSIKLLYDACPNTTLINVYGPTENTVMATRYVVQREDVNKPVIPIGTPIAKTNVYILDADDQLCDVNCKGELCVGGYGIADHYLNNPELTKKRFVYIPALNEIVYRTGDFAMIGEDGNIMFFGREDNQVKVRGYRIELDEIRMKMLEYPSVQAVSVMVEKDSTDNKIICVYYIATDIVTPSEIRSYLKNQLPAYSMPNYFYQMKEFPLTVNGKIDQERLRGMKSESINLRNSNTAAEYTQTEKTILRIFNELFFRDDLDIEDDFFEEGGNSLQVGQVIARIRKELNVDISASVFFNHSKVKQLSEYIDENCEEIKETELHQHDKKEFYDLSEAQRRIFFASYTDKKSVVYNIPYAFLVEGNMDSQKLRKAFSKLVERHSILRAVFTQKEGDPVQRIIPADDFVVNKMNIIEEVRDEYSDDLLPEIFADFIRPFDYDNGPLWRCEIINFKNGKCVFLFDIHHLIFDGASQKTLFDELSKLYQNEDALLEPLQFDYLDFVQWSNSRKKSESYEALGRYWKSFFDQEIRDLDIRKKTIANQTDEKGVTRFRLPLSFVDSVSRQIKDEHVTMYNYVISCLGIVLSKFFDQRQFYIGSILAGRDMHQFMDVIGMFVNTTLFKVDPDPKEKMSSFMARNKKQIMEMIDNQDFSLEDIKNCDVYAEGQNNSDFLQTVFVMENMEALDLNLGKTRVKRLDIANNRAKFDLLFICENEPDGLLFQIEYRKSAVEPAVAESLCGAIKHVLISSLDNNTERNISDIEIVDEEQKQKILNHFNNTGREFDETASICDMFAKCVRENRELPALLWKDRFISYSELDRRTDAIAGYLSGKGIKPGEVVALYLEDKLHQIEGILAVLKTGAVYMPIDTAYPEKRVKYMLKDSASRFVLLEKQNLDREAISDVGHIVIDNLDETRSEIARTTDSFACDGESAAYLMYTSGTTGNPKGVLVKHKNIVRLVSNTNFMEFKKGGKFLQTSSVVFDASTLEIWGSLLNGMCLCLTKKEEVLSPISLRKYIKDLSIDALWLSAPLFNQISRGNEDMFQGVTWLLVGGDKLPSEQIHKVRRANKDLHVLNGYGPTENTTFSTVFEVDDDYEDIPIGYPIANSTAYIMDQAKNLLPIGAVGEICVGGSGIATGYINDDELTDRKFIKNPYVPGDRLYCTGDIGRWNEKGYIEFFGRKDNQVKIRGFRVEPKEIENLVSKANVRDCLVDVREKDGNKFLVLFYVGDISQEELNHFIVENLPEYMRPSYLIHLDEMLLNVNGKFDYAKIREIKLNDIASAKNLSTYEEPQNETQKAICEVWQEVLGADRVGISDNYFDIGGDSIKAIIISGKLYQKGIDVSAADILATKNIKALSAISESAVSNKEISNVKYELSPIQKWFFDHVKEDYNHFNQSVILKLKKQVNLEEIKDAWRVLKEHHELLNAHFTNENGARFMVIDTGSHTVAFSEIHVNGGEKQRIITEEAERCQRSLDIHNGPLCRIVLFNDESDQHILIVMHHMIVDNVSWRILINDFSDVLMGKKETSEGWNNTASYHDWIQDVDKYVSSVFEAPNNEEGNASFLGNAQKSCLSSQMRMITRVLDESNTTHLLNDVHHRYHTKVQDILVAALVCAAKKYCDEETLNIQMESYGRENDYSKLNVSETIGWFTSIYPVEITMTDDGYEKQIIEVKDQLNRVQNHGIGYNAYYYGENGSSSKSEKSFVSFNYLGAFKDDLNTDAFEDSEYSSGDEVTGFYIRPSIDINAEISNNCLEVHVDYGMNLYSEEQMNELMDGFISELLQIIEHCMASQEASITSSDFSVEGLDESALDDILSGLQNSFL